MKIFLVLGCLVAALGAMSHAQAADDECYVECVPAGSFCGPTNAQPSAKGKGAILRPCSSARISSGKARGLVSTSKGVQIFVVNEAQKPFSEQVGKLFAGCFGGSPACVESIDRARVGAAAGKGIDATEAVRVGEPCAIGLPCGDILLPAEPLVIDVALAEQGARLEVKAFRNATGSFEVPVDAGRATLPPGSLKAGAAYLYKLQAGGKVLAAGSFTVISSKMQSDLQPEIAAARADPAKGQFDVLEILLDSELRWDAARLTR